MRATLKGNFRLANGVIEFSRLRLAISGAELALAGSCTFDRDGAGTQLQVRIDGTREQPHFGRDRGK